MLQEDSCPDYMQKAEDCLRAEEGRVAAYLHINSKVKLMHKVCLGPMPAVQDACLVCPRPTVNPG